MRLYLHVKTAKFVTRQPRFTLSIFSLKKRYHVMYCNHAVSVCKSNHAVYHYHDEMIQNKVLKTPNTGHRVSKLIDFSSLFLKARFILLNFDYLIFYAKNFSLKCRILQNYTFELHIRFL